MKLFQKLIVAPATLGLLIPSAAFAEEIKLADISNYSSSKEVKSISDFDPAEEIAVTNSRVDGLESRFNDFEAGSFSDTTTMSGSAGFLVGAASGPGSTNEAVMAEYFYEVDLNTSFTGEDKLNIEIETGNAPGGTGTPSTVLDWGAGSADTLKISDINYTFPVGEYTVAVGDSMDASKTWPNACAVSNTVDALGDCGAANSVDLGGDQSISVSRSFGDGWEIGAGISASDGETTQGIFTEEGNDFYGLALGYETDTYGFTVAYSSKESTDITAGASATAYDVGDPKTETTYTGIVGYYSPESMPTTFSAGYEIGDPDGGEETTQYTLGISTEVGEGTLNVSMGTNGSFDDTEDETLAYDASYAYPINDSMEVVPFVYILEGAGSVDDTTGFGASMSFSF